MGNWVAPLVERLGLDIGSGRDLTVLRSSPAWGGGRLCTERGASLRFSLSLYLSASSPCLCALSLSVSKIFFLDLGNTHTHRPS